MTGIFTRMGTTPAEILELAPAAGSGLGKAWATELLEDPKLIAREMAALVHRGFHAKTRRWDPGSKDWLVDDDMRSQLQTLALVVSHLVGEPAKKIIHEYRAEGGIDPLAALQESPALLEQAERLIEKAKWRKSGRAKKVEPTKPAEGEIG